LDFVNGATKYAEWTILMPDNYNGGTLSVQFVWTATTAGAGNVIWGIQGFAIASAETLNRTYSIPTEITQAYSNTYVSHVTSVGTLTVQNTPTGGKAIQLRVYRKGASDTFTQTVRLLMVKLEYTINAYSD
jgi:hypothetical protein